MAGSAIRLPFEQHLATCRRCLIEAVRRRVRRGDRELVGMQSRQLARDQVWAVPYVAKSCRRGDRELVRIVQTRIVEGTGAVHLQVGHKGVPVGYPSPPSPGVEVYACEAERRGNQRGSRLSVRTEGLAVQDQFRIELAGTPTIQHGPNGSLVNTEQFGERGYIRRRRDDGADVEITVGPAIQPRTDTRSERVIDGGVAERALDADRLQGSVLVEESLDANHRVFLEQGQRGGWVVEIDFPFLDRADEISWQRIGIDLQPQGQCGFWAYARTDAAELLALNGVVEAKGVTPEGLATERIIPEDVSALSEELTLILLNLGIEAYQIRLGGMAFSSVG